MSHLTGDISIEQIDEWFKIGVGKPKATTIPRSKLQGHYLDPETGDAYRKRETTFIPNFRRNPRENNPKQTEYAQKYLQEERQRELRLAVEDDPGLPGLGRERGGLSDLDFASTSDAYDALGFPGDKPVELATDVYKHYRFDHTYSPDLPITQYQDQIITTIESNQVTVIQGSTGSGKTTQVPQYILDHYVKENRYCNIVVTQPRRIAAISIAKRVSDERGWQLGSLVGYQVAMDRCTSDDTRLTFLTTGVLLQKLINTKNMNQFTHVILDEVHERDQDSDFCLLVVRKLLRSTSRHVKVVLMSATIDSDLFSQYFSLPVRGELESAPVVNVEGKAYDVTEFYLEDICKMRTGQMPFLESDKPSVSNEARELARQLILGFDREELQDQEERVDNFPANRGTVLVFLPGIIEINDMYQCLNSDLIPHRLWVLPLHSSITREEQSKVFTKSEKGRRKVILATNIAESSITVPDIKYVIDFMLIKCLVCDPETNYQSLQLNWASKANAIQRKGRAGRVSSGKVYRMITTYFWDRYIKEHGIPEMARCPLEHLVLQVKLLDLGEPKAILGLALTPPNLDDIERTILLLKEVGALSTVSSSSINPHDGDLTFVGRVLASLPVDIKIGKLLVLGHVFGCLESAVVIGAALSFQSFFSQPFRAQLDAYRSKMAWADWSFSDLIAMLNAYKAWEEGVQSGEFRRTGQAEVQWGRKNLIQIKRIKEVAELAKELKERLARHNIRVPRGPNMERNMYITDPVQDLLILKLVLCGAFYPNYFVCGPADEAEAVRALSGKDPLTTVMVKGVPPMGHLYKNQIASIFRPCGKGKRLYFEDTRCYVEFERPRSTDGQPTDNNVLPAVFLAVKMRHIRMRMELQLTEISPADQKLLNKDFSQTNRLRTNRVGVMCDESTTSSQKIQLIKEDGGGPRQVTLPAPDQNWIDLFVTEVVEANRFWAHYGDHETFEKLRQLMITINQCDGYDLKPITNELQNGHFCLAPYEDEAKYYRARVQSLKGNIVEVFFLDYGNVEIVERRKIREIPPELLTLPFQAFECVLQGIKPFYRLPDGRWMPQAKDRLIQLVSNKIMFANVYSIVQNTLRIDLIDTTKEPQLNINDLLIRMEFAEKAEEPYSSKVNHEQREDADISASVDEHWVEIPQETVMRILEQGRKKGRVFLHGPFSPYEMNFYPMTQVGRFRSTRIEPNSVNSVALNEEAQDKHDRMMVAALVSVNSSGTTLVARDTTLMPNIHGLPALVSMLFAPTIELRTDSRKSRYTGALCGLGIDPDTYGPALPDHDMEITFDVSITADDITMINGVRMAVNLAVGSEDAIADWGPAAIFKIQKSAREKLLRLIMKRRESVIPYNFDRPYRWNLVNPDDVLPHGLEDTSANCPVLYQLHDGIAVSGDIEVNEDTAEKREKMIAHVRDLRVRAGRSMTSDPIICQLCQVLCQTPRDLLLHLETRAHQEEERALYQPK
ncbi:ATP-dependent RNA helicase TDRD9-like [Glandiceps talaboti]